MAQPKIKNWSGGEHAFLLRIGEAEALDDITAKGVADFRYRCRTGVERGSLSFSEVKIREVMDCFRLGLIGGGMSPVEAQALARRAIEEADFSELVLICFDIVSTFFAGKEHDQPEKPKAVGADQATA